MTNNTTADLDRDIAHLIDSSENGIARVPRETLVRLRALLTSPRAAGLPNLIEKIAEQWDGCFFDAPGGCDIDIGEAIRAAAKRLDAAPAAPVAEISAGTEPNPSKESGQSEAVISARGFDDQAVAADGEATDEPIDIALASVDPCPFCGSDSVDPKGWAGNDGRTGPACDECGATAETIAGWNRRAAVSPATADERVAFTDQQIYDRFSFLEGVVNERNYRKIADTAIEIARASQAAAPQANAAEESEDAYVIRRLSETLADVAVTLRGDDPVHPDDPLNKIELVKRLAEVLRMEVELYRAQAAAPAEAREPFPYQKTFDAIAAATSITAGGHVSISVEAFRKAFGAIPADAGEAVAYLVTGGRIFKDKPFLSKEAAEQSVRERNDGASIKPLGVIDARAQGAQGGKGGEA
ncbi:Lar family restriction alleviation protein [Burkholderia gladioli]|uniref:Lar family restriction alleviation protein n=1 Tax=Burkholderia gladioli TaxID=28095 RepID=UPI00163E7A78